MAGYDIGPRIGIEGEKEFRQSIQDINTRLKTLGTEMGVVASQYDKSDKSMEALTARNTVLTKQVEAQQEKLRLLNDGLAAATAKYGENSEVTQRWQQAVNRATADLNNMEGALRENAEDLERLGDAGRDAGGGLDEAGEGARRAGQNAGDSGGKWGALATGLQVAAAAATATAAAIAAVTAAAAAAVGALADMTVGAAAYADEIITMSSVTGMSQESLQAYSYAADLVDVSLDTLTGSMAKNVKSMNSARGGTGAAAEAYSALGVAVTNADGTLRDGEEVYWSAIDALGQMEEGAERDALAMTLFGKSAQDLNPLIAQGSSGIAELTEEAKRMGAVMSDDALSELGAFDDTVQRLTAGSEAAKNALGLVLLPALQGLGTTGVDLLGDFTQAMNAAGSDWLLTGDASAMGDAVSGLVTGIATAAVEALPNLISTAGTLLTAFGSAIKESLPVLLDAASQIISELVRGISHALPQITDSALEILLMLVDTIIANLPVLIQAALQVVMSLVLGIAEALPELVPAAYDMIATLVEGLVQQLPMLIETAIQIVLALAETLAAEPEAMLDAALRIILAIAEGLVLAIPQLLLAVPRIILGLFSAFTSDENEKEMLKAGEEMLAGVAEGLRNFLPNLVSQAKEVLGNLVDNIKGFLGIHSPSTVFADVGNDMAAGLGAGFDGEMSGVAGTMEGAVGNVGVVTAEAAIAAINSGIIANIGLLDSGTNAIVQKIMTLLAAQNAKLTQQGLQWSQMISTGLGAGLPFVIAAANKIIVSLGQGFTLSLPLLLSEIPKITSAMAAKFTAYKWDRLGRDIIQGIRAGVIAAAQALAEAVVQAARDAMAAAKAALDINSPSRVFRDEVGLMMGLGIAEGVTESQKQINDAMTRLSGAIDFSPVIGVEAGAAKDRMEIVHSGTIRVEGVNDGGQIVGIANVAVEQALVRIMRQQARLTV
jgi:hypothetical protein